MRRYCAILWENIPIGDLPGVRRGKERQWCAWCVSSPGFLAYALSFHLPYKTPQQSLMQLQPGFRHQDTHQLTGIVRKYVFAKD